MKNMKRIVLLFMIMVMNIVASAQVFIMDDDEFNRGGLNGSDISLIVPLQDVTYDQYEHEYTPLADGLGLLIGLGGAYLLGKKRKKC